MLKKIIIIMILLMFVGCKDRSDTEHNSQMEGHWSVESEVTLLREMFQHPDLTGFGMLQFLDMSHSYSEGRPYFVEMNSRAEEEIIASDRYIVIRTMDYPSGFSDIMFYVETSGIAKAYRIVVESGSLEDKMKRKVTQAKYMDLGHSDLYTREMDSTVFNDHFLFIAKTEREYFERPNNRKMGGVVSIVSFGNSHGFSSFLLSDVNFSNRKEFRKGSKGLFRNVSLLKQLSNHVKWSE